VYPVLFHFGSILIPAYGASAAVGVLLALFLAERTARMAGLDARKVWTLCVVALFVALAGSRLLLVALNWTDLRLHPMWLLGLAMVHHPLLACFGTLAAVVAAVLYGRRQRLPLWTTADVLAAPVALGLAFEQLGALLAGSGYGTGAGTGSAARWAVTYTHPLAAVWSGAPLGVPLHPVQAYASLAFLVLFAFLLFWLPYRRQSGDVVGLFLLGAGVAIFITEFWRDPEGRGALLGALDGPQAAAVALVVAGGLVLLERKTSVVGQTPSAEMDPAVVSPPFEVPGAKDEAVHG
jgi:phosphatidylglycerol:prolipoprotein diacylglycerol transferase